MPHDFQDDIDAVQSIAAVPTILDVVCQSTGMRFAAVARVTEDRWITCHVLDNVDFGLKPGDELKVETTICNEIRQSRELVVFDNAAEDANFRSHPTPAMYGLKSYISVPIVRKDGSFFGTLCAIDPDPAKVNNPRVIGMFKLFAELVAFHLDAKEEIIETRAALSTERKTSELREQFVAVLGHDLRNPIAAVEAGSKMLLRGDLSDDKRQVVTMMQASLLRMRGLIDNVLNFARTRLGDGLVLEVGVEQPLEPTLRQVVAEIRAFEPDRKIEAEFDMVEKVTCDHLKMSQLLSNLLGNAITHGAEDAPVRVSATARNGSFELWVENAGDPIPKEAMKALFRPFFRGKARESRQGLGLGLYIASEIARVHGGTLEVTSDEQTTRFTFRMPTTSASRQAAMAEA